MSRKPETKKFKTEVFIKKDKALAYNLEGIITYKMGIDCTTGDCTPTKTQEFIVELVELMIKKKLFTGPEVAKLLSVEHFEVSTKKK